MEGPLPRGNRPRMSVRRHGRLRDRAGEHRETSERQLTRRPVGESNVRVLGEIRLSAGLTDRLSLVVSWNLRHDSRPPDGVDGLDSALKTGFTVTIEGP